MLVGSETGCACTIVCSTLGVSAVGVSVTLELNASKLGASTVGSTTVVLSACVVCIGSTGVVFSAGIVTGASAGVFTFSSFFLFFFSTTIYPIKNNSNTTDPIKK